MEKILNLENMDISLEATCSKNLEQIDLEKNKNNEKNINNEKIIQEKNNQEKIETKLIKKKNNKIYNPYNKSNTPKIIGNGNIIHIYTHTKSANFGIVNPPKLKCYRCGLMGHIARDCKKPKR
ncbi:uncharacterized protein PF3D7_1120600-like [Daktulosphaira vitifoliae]|uniref:uncharacterized protein PF3D7_1120600-like n=1 Tax=Daktulosphaira vitifoliae TaxID=58002 RepID=UPI0021AA5965|nr:uncharacterized protein PF3D7_1120600-like [Daktulosphaira vitifoliae]XP_050528881.1 uncharacterized protein PF3D7_1120600-like [Daktulosphaira vitifoliae]XP_050528882.1 uncharacterized protein PF3D7_1120600-like [Daktulosphaira vitifoliae]